MPSSIIALLTDFGAKDYFVGAMKGAILSINRAARIIDITHEIAPQNISSAAFTLRACCKNFPAKTIFVAVVDPGVGSDRKAILVETNDYYFIAPDNGLLSFVFEAEKNVRVYELSNDRFFAAHVSQTFHGRDIFATVAAHLSNGTAPHEFGAEIENPVRFKTIEPRKISDAEIEAEIMHADRFGNLITNLASEDLPADFTLEIGDKRIAKLQTHYAEANAGELFMIAGSAGFLEIAVFGDSAERLLNARAGQKIGSSEISKIFFNLYLERRFVIFKIRAKFNNKGTKRQMSTATESTAATAGLRGVVAAQSAIGDVNGEKGILIYQGYDIHDLAENSTFEEVIFLLWNGKLPTGSELEDLTKQFRSNYSVPDEVLEMMRRFPKDANPMDVLRTSVSALGFYDAEGHATERDAAVQTAIKLTGQIGTLVAAWERIRTDKDIVAPDSSLSIAENFLYMLRGETAEPDEAHMFDVALILHADHELNASTFTTRVVAGTLEDMYGAVTAGIAALAGPLHGGANTNVMKMLKEIGSEENIDSWLDKALEEKRKIMGIGHAVYKTEDPRATWLRKFSKQLGEKKGEMKWFNMSQRIEKEMLERKGMYPNVDFYSASAYYLMDIPLDQYTPIFAVSRISGWTGHILEQYGNNKLIRPRAEYIGKRDQKYVPIEER